MLKVRKLNEMPNLKLAFDNFLGKQQQITVYSSNVVFVVLLKIRIYIKVSSKDRYLFTYFRLRTHDIRTHKSSFGFITDICSLLVHYIRSYQFM